MFFGPLTANLAAVICFSRSAKALLRRRYTRVRDIPVYIVPNGHYRGCYQDVISREARQKLGLGGEELVFLFIGQLRRHHKNEIRLIECLRDGARQDWRLAIAGEPRDAATSRSPRLRPLAVGSSRYSNSFRTISCRSTCALVTW